MGIGELGAQGRADGLPRYVGGYFWWYYATDAVPWDRPRSLWPTLESLSADVTR